MNTYGYVGGNPLYWIDPFGLEAGGIALPNPNKGIGSLGDILPPWVLKGPGMCLFLLTYTSPYDPDVAACDENPTQCPYYNEDGGDDASGEKDRPDNQKNPEEAADSISKAQEKLKKRDRDRRNWDPNDDWGDLPRPKGSPIDSTDKTTNKNWKKYY